MSPAYFPPKHLKASTFENSFRLLREIRKVNLGIQPESETGSWDALGRPQQNIKRETGVLRTGFWSASV